MASVRKPISLPSDLAEEAEETARTQGKTLSAVVQDALRLARAERMKADLKEIQGFWMAKAKEKGILTEDDLDRFLER